MKKNLLLFCALFSCTIITYAQAYKKGDNMVNLGIGIGSPFFGSGYNASLPVNPTFTYEHGVSNEISVGGTISYASAKYEGEDVDYNTGNLYHTTYKTNATFIGVRGSYHFNVNNDKYDLYAGAGLGYVLLSGDGYSVSSGVGYTAFGGGKYYFSKKTAVYAELGYASLSFLNVGIALKF